MAVVVGTCFAVGEAFVAVVGSFVVVAGALIDVVGTLVAVVPCMEVAIVVSFVDFLSVAVNVAVVTLIVLVCITDVASEFLDVLAAPTVLDDSVKVEIIFDVS